MYEVVVGRGESKSPKQVSLLFPMRPAVSVPHKEPRPERFDLGDGLVMRWSTKEDKDNIADCLADAFRVKKELVLFRR